MFGLISVAIITSTVVVGVYSFYTKILQWKSLVASLIVSLIVSSSSSCIYDRFAYGDTEYWTSYLTQVSYKEGWTEIKTETYTDSKGKTQTRTVVVNHPPEWNAMNSNGHSVNINDAQYKSLAIRWGHNPATGGWFGIKHDYKWNGDINTAEICTTSHYYENRAVNSNSLYKKGMDKKEASTLELYDWPKLYGYNADFVLDKNNITSNKFKRDIAILNADYGNLHQIRINILIFVDKDVSIVTDQDTYWKGGKKNELNICIGQNSAGVVQWCRCISWSNSEQLKAEIANFVQSQEKLDYDKFTSYLRQNIPDKWQRLEFKQFNYIEKDIPFWLYGIVLLLTIPASIFISIKLLMVDYHAKSTRVLKNSFLTRFS